MMKACWGVAKYKGQETMYGYKRGLNQHRGVLSMLTRLASRPSPIQPTSKSVAYFLYSHPQHMHGYNDRYIHIYIYTHCRASSRRRHPHQVLPAPRLLFQPAPATPPTPYSSLPLSNIRDPASSLDSASGTFGPCSSPSSPQSVWPSLDVSE